MAQVIGGGRWVAVGQKAVVKGDEDEKGLNAAGQEVAAQVGLDLMPRVTNAHRAGNGFYG